MAVKGWTLSPLSSVIASVEGGVSVNAGDRPAAEHEIGILKTSAVTSGTFCAHENKVVLDEKERRRVSVAVAPDSLIFCRKNTPDLVGASAYVKKGYPNLYLSDLLWLIKVDSCKVSGEWLNIAFQTEGVRAKIARLASGTSQSMRNISKKSFLGLRLAIPPLDEQKRIVSVVSAWDIAIEKLSNIITAKLQCRRVLVQDLLSGRRRFVEFSGKPWKPMRIRELIVESRIPGTDGRTAKKITVKLYGKGVVEKEEKQPGSANTKYYVRRVGQFIYSKLDFLNGAFGIIPKNLDGYETTLDLPCFDFTDKVVPEYFLRYVAREEFYNTFHGSAIGGRKARRISPDELLNREIPLPEKPEQRKIVALLTTADAEITNLQQQLERLKKQKQGLMEQLLTGKKRLNAKPKAA